MLTGNEYALLSAARSGLESALSESLPNWVAAAQNACLTVTFGPSTPLLASQEASCLEWVGLQVRLATLTPAYNRCARRGRKRTILCRAPLFNGLARDAAGVYTADAKAHRAIVDRGFTGACATELGSTATQLRDAHQLVSSTRTLLADWQLLVGSVEGRTPGTGVKQARIERDTNVVTSDIRLLSRDEPPVDLSRCPHQMA
jgi:hypothetical protein